MIYFITDEDEEYVKIGYTKNKDVTNRLSCLQTGCPLKLKIFAEIEGGMHMENKLHAMFTEYQTAGEWFIFGGKIKDFICDLAGDNLSSVAVFYKELYSQMLLGKDIEALKMVKMNLLSRANDTRKTKKEGRQDRIMDLIKDHTQPEIAKILDVSLSTIKRDIKQLNGNLEVI